MNWMHECSSIPLGFYLAVVILLKSYDCQPFAASDDSSIASTKKDFAPTQASTRSAQGEALVPKEHPKEHIPPSWLVYTSAIPTVFVFVACVVVIFVKQFYAINEDLSAHEPIDRPTPVKKKKSKSKKSNQGVYDELLAKFKDDKNRKRSFVGRKSSQIRIEGMASRSPKSLARKHIIIGQLAEEDLQPDGNSSALGQLVQLSTHTFIGSSVVEDMDPPTWQEQAKEQAKKDLSERLMMEYDENDALLPEDLEDVFSNFGNWEESLI